MPELPNDQPHQLPKQSHAEDHTEQIEATSKEDHRWRTGRLQSRKTSETLDRVWHTALWATMKQCNISTNLIQVIKNPCDKVTSAVLFNSSIGDWFRTIVGVQQGCLLSPILFNILLERIMTRHLRRSWRHCKHWRQNNHQSLLCWWHWWLSGRGITTGKISWVSQQSLHSLWHGDQCQEDQADDKQHQWHHHRDESKCTEAWDCH